MLVTVSRSVAGWRPFDEGSQAATGGLDCEASRNNGMQSSILLARKELGTAGEEENYESKLIDQTKKTREICKAAQWRGGLDYCLYLGPATNHPFDDRPEYYTHFCMICS